MADIPAKLVKELRDKTGVGFADCKKALEATDGDLEKAVEWLRQRGIAKAGAKSDRITAEGIVEQYIHTGGRVGVLVEVNCQTDFVARNEAFKALAKSVAMQIAACPNVEYVRIEDIPPDVVAKEKAIEMGKDDLANKPENVREKIVEGRIDKRLKEMSLMDQPYVRDQSITVDELVKQHIASLGENIRVRRFQRYTLGEGIEKKEEDFAAEVAAQMGTKAEEPPAKAEEPPVKAEEPPVKAEEPPVVESDSVDEAAPDAEPESPPETKGFDKGDKGDKGDKKDKKKKKK